MAPKRRLGKRWYINAGIGKSVPFIGGSTFSAGSGALSKRSLQTLIRQTGELKQKYVANIIATACTHNTIMCFNPFGNIPIGTGINARTGSSIFVKSWLFNVVLSNNGATTGLDHINWRIMVVEIDSEYLSGSDGLTGGVGSTDVFQQGANQFANAPPDYNRAKILYDHVHLLRSSGSTGKSCIHLNLTFCKDKMFKYNGPTSNYSNKGNVYLLIIPYVPGSTSGVTIVGDVRADSLVNFTDA